ncbi:MAG: hypothetical protein ACP5I4_04605 [Oceanipulchritudo sp.]
MLSLPLNNDETLFSAQFDAHWRQHHLVGIEAPPEIVVHRRDSWEAVWFEWHLLSKDAPSWRLVFDAATEEASSAACLICCLQLESESKCRIHFVGKEGGYSSGEWQQGANWRTEIMLTRPGFSVKKVILEIQGGSMREDFTLAIHWLAWAKNPNRVPRQIGRPRTISNFLIHGADITNLAPTHAFLFDADSLESLRKRSKHPSWSDLYGNLQKTAREALIRNPLEEMLPYSPWGDDRFARPYEKNRRPFFHDGLTCGLIGILEKDEALCHKALEFLGAMLLTPHWKPSEQCDVPGSAWDMRCFIEEQTTTACVILLDWFGAALEEGFLAFARRKLYDSGISVIERDLALHEYVHSMNQGIWFSRGRILGLLWLETAWPRLRERTDQAMDECQTMLKNYIKPDGSIHEGIGYYGLTLEVACGALYAYSRRRNCSLKDLLPDGIRNSESYLAALALDQPGRFHTVGDNADERLYSDAFTLLAGLYPGSVFANLAAAVSRPPEHYSYFQHYVGHGVYAFIWGSDELIGATTIQKPETHLSVLGISVISRANADGIRLRAWLTGKAKDESHSHDDAGSVLLEVDETPVLIDRGVDRYESISNLRLMRSRRHNCLTPSTPEGFDYSQKKGAGHCPVINVGPSSLEVELGKPWDAFFKSYKRGIQLTPQGELSIRDCGESIEPRGIAVHFQTPLEVEKKDNVLFLCGDKAIVSLHAEWAENITLEQDSLDAMKRTITHIRLEAFTSGLFEYRTVLLPEGKP